MQPTNNNTANNHISVNISEIDSKKFNWESPTSLPNSALSIINSLQNPQNSHISQLEKDFEVLHVASQKNLKNYESINLLTKHISNGSSSYGTFVEKTIPVFKNQSFFSQEERNLRLKALTTFPKFSEGFSSNFSKTHGAIDMMSSLRYGFISIAP